MINALFKFEDLDAEFTAYVAYDDIYILVQIGDEQDIIKAIYQCIGLLFELLVMIIILVRFLLLILSLQDFLQLTSFLYSHS
jgi:hypothetical protein